jgi:hypothetical protein
LSPFFIFGAIVRLCASAMNAAESIKANSKIFFIFFGFLFVDRKFRST